jgi:class 3 adenylate cyclase
MCLVVTDIENSTMLSVFDPHACAMSQDIHDTIMLELIRQYQGVELLREGDSFRVAFHHVHHAVLFCLKVRPLPW